MALKCPAIALIAVLAAALLLGGCAAALTTDKTASPVPAGCEWAQPILLKPETKKWLRWAQAAYPEAGIRDLREKIARHNRLVAQICGEA